MTGKSLIGADKIILGFTGSIGSGCTYIAEGISNYYPKYKYFCLSDTLKHIAKEREISKPTVEQLQELGNSLRAEHGNSYLVQKTLETVEESPDIDSCDGIIIDSIRNDVEVQTLRQFPYFYLFSIHADQTIRCERTLKMKKFATNDEFYKADERDQSEDIPFGQQVIRCNDLADIIINNNKHIAKQATTTKKQFIDSIYNKYLELIESKKKGKLTPENLPSIDETLMTMSYAESQRSSCLKRKVGTVIVSIKTFSKSDPDKAIKESVNVISSAHNEVPYGAISCIFHPEFEKCYRDYLQENQAQKIKNCPNCGEKIKFHVIKCNNCMSEYSAYLKVCSECKRELEVNYLCPKCNTNIFKVYLLSGGKLLDMCRALHAEENAILNLSKISYKNSDELVLYTTTYPCNLCANKIVTAGIKKIVYADPYPMKEAKKF